MAYRALGGCGNCARCPHRGCARHPRRMGLGDEVTDVLRSIPLTQSPHIQAANNPLRPAPLPWLPFTEQEFIPGVKNKYLLYGAAGIAVLAALGKAGGRR